MKFDLTLDILDACREGKLERIHEILRHTSDAWKSKNDQVALQALSSGNVSIVKVLIDHGLVIPDGKLGSYLVLAVQLRSIELLDFLISLGADINYQDNSGDTPLHAAVHSELDIENRDIDKSFRTLRHCLLLGANPELEGSHGWKPLSLARMYGSTEVEKILSDKVL